MCTLTIVVPALWNDSALFPKDTAVPGKNLAFKFEL